MENKIRIGKRSRADIRSVSEPCVCVCVCERKCVCVCLQKCANECVAGLCDTCAVKRGFCARADVSNVQLSAHTV